MRHNNEVLIYFGRYQQNRYGVTRTWDCQTFEGLSERLHVPADMRHAAILRVPDEIVEALR